jgi:hypothetical protein
MAVIRFAGFAGENRALEPKLLPDSVCTISRNQKPGRGDLRSWKSPSTVATIPAGRQTIYRMGRDVDTDTQFWLSWPSVVHAVRGFSATDTTEQTFYTGDGAPKFTNNLALNGTNPQSNPTATRPMGIPAPSIAPTVTGSSPTPDPESPPTIESYFYVYTYVNDLGWESAPSPVSAEVERDNLGSTTIFNFAAVPAGNYNVATIRIYKTQTGSSGSEFFFLREVAYGTSSTTDDNRTLGEVMETTGWLPAPGVPTGGVVNTTEPNLSNLTAMWNGMMAGITGNSVRISEPYTPYAWPAAYDILPPDGKPVALGVFGQSMLVLTTGRPLLVSGSSPDGMDQQPLEIPQGCVSSRSVVSMGSGVAWASEDGLCWFGAGGPRVLTSGIATREDWQALVPSSIIGQMYEGLYFGSYDAGAGRKGFMIDPFNPNGIFFLDTGYSAMHFDELKDQLYVLSGTNVQKWDAGSPFTFVARSKVYKRPFPTNFGVAEVIASAYPVTFRLFADGVLKHTQTVLGRDPFRLPSGFRAFDFQIELEGTNAIQGCAVASEMKELAEV